VESDENDDNDADSVDVKLSKRSSCGTVSKQKEPVPSVSKQTVSNGELTSHSVARGQDTRSSTGGGRRNTGVRLSAAKENHCIDADKQVITRRYHFNSTHGTKGLLLIFMMSVLFLNNTWDRSTDKNKSHFLALDIFL